MNIIIAGGSGFIGSTLVNVLQGEGHAITVLARNERSANEKLGGKARVLPWDGEFVGAWAEAVNGADVVVNLAGESIGDGRWSGARKEKILQSRLKATRAIVDAIIKAEKKPSLLINASAVGFYGNVPSGDVDESHAPGDDFLANVCKEWELEARRAESAGVRVALIRTGIVLSKNGGALPRMLTPFKFFVGGKIGSGNQWMPWIHLVDHIGIITYIINNQSVSGAVNLSAPEPATMKEFARALGKAMHRPSLFPVPGFVLKVMLGKMSSLVLEGQRAVPKKILAAGYVFKFPQLDAALRDVLKKR
ncbi:MAG TPA: TIGR01777 family oxidoreductase [Candidatus Kapabacteria bacterium]|nr:TIGR01777 family oxidoreductase [Candidatus Kapabacteria bacterium]